MQASGALRAASQYSRSQATRRTAATVSKSTLSGRTISVTLRTRFSTLSQSRSPALERQQFLFGAVRMLHQSHYLLAAQKSTPPSAPTSASSVPSTTPEKTNLATKDFTSTKVTDTKANKTLTERAKELWATAKYLFKFYFSGVKQIWANRKRVKEVQARVANGGSGLTREESQLMHVHKADMRKLPLFLFILLILEEALPLVVIWAPSLLPSTCILPNQLAKIRMGEEVKRAEAFQQLKQSDSLKELIPVIEESKEGLRLTNVHREQTEQDILKTLSSEDLTKLAKIFSLSTWGGAAMIRRRLDSHLTYIRQDDLLMCADGDFGAIPLHADALAKACGERGLRCSGIEHHDMFESLRSWLCYTTDNPETKDISKQSVALLPLQMYSPSSLQEVKDELEAESVRGLMDKTKDMLRQVVEEEKKVLSRDENAKLEPEFKQQQQQQNK
ncbi:uncharacterized protein UBRO_04671 [Ustilago bromivora]|uniref:Letm1 RBD domain-containing protein n=1 Tax=Ustilago bromivora TaxID=307758 RepID=A0A1K0G4F1_9BASI|nr:uncharacterized protein UBRO_04671 [Ustilago bromivora]SYW82821.1 uncharacterized protein UBRO2_04943 [Ustilago bromivora]